MFTLDFNQEEKIYCPQGLGPNNLSKELLLYVVYFYIQPVIMLYLLFAHLQKLQKLQEL